MGDVVKTIYQAVESVVQTELSFTAAANRMRYVIDPSKNDFKTIKDAYGILRLDAEPAAGVNRSYTMDHAYQVLLTGRVVNKLQGDQEVQEVLHILYNRSDTVLKALINKKLGLSTTVLNVFNQAWLAPEIFDENRLVLLRTAFTIKFREPLN